MNNLGRVDSQRSYLIIYLFVDGLMPNQYKIQIKSLKNVTDIFVTAI